MNVIVSIVQRSYDFPELELDRGRALLLRRLADLLDGRCRAIRASVGPVSMERLLLLAAIHLTDELEEARAAIERFEASARAEADAARLERRRARRLARAAA
jgi:cell division protein ZapA (FtsZ GTPase activity inhibitor)